MHWFCALFLCTHTALEWDRPNPIEERPPERQQVHGVRQPQRLPRWLEEVRHRPEGSGKAVQGQGKEVKRR